MLQELWHTGLAAPRLVGSSGTRDGTRVLCIGRRILTHWTASEVPSAVFLETQTVFVSRALKPIKMRPQRAERETGHLTPVP